MILHTSAIVNLKSDTSPVPSIISVELEFVGMRANYFTFITKPARNLEGCENTQKEKNNCIVGRFTYNISYRLYKTDRISAIFKEYTRRRAWKAIGCRLLKPRYLSRMNLVDKSAMYVRVTLYLGYLIIL